MKFTPSLNDIKNKAAELLAERMDVAVETIDLDTKLTNFGLDSIDAVTLVGDLEDWLDIELPSTLLWDFDNFNEVSAHILQSLRVTAVA